MDNKINNELNVNENGLQKKNNNNNNNDHHFVSLWYGINVVVLSGLEWCAVVWECGPRGWCEDLVDKMRADRKSQPSREPFAPQDLYMCLCMHVSCAVVCFSVCFFFGIFPSLFPLAFFVSFLSFAFVLLILANTIYFCHIFL